MTVPYVISHHTEAEKAGLGDVAFGYKHVLSSSNGVMTSNRFALLVDTIVPTGASNDPALPPRAQLGFGTPRVGVGLVYSIIRDRHRASIEVAIWSLSETATPEQPG